MRLFLGWLGVGVASLASASAALAADIDLTLVRPLVCELATQCAEDRCQIDLERTGVEQHVLDGAARCNSPRGFVISYRSRTGGLLVSEGTREAVPYLVKAVAAFQPSPGDFIRPVRGETVLIEQPAAVFGDGRIDLFLRVVLAASRDQPPHRRAQR